MRNPYDLAAIIARHGRASKRPTVLRPVVPPASLEKVAIRIGMKVVIGWAEQVRDLILPVYAAALDALIRDDATDNLASAMSSAEATQSRLVLALGPDLNNWAVEVEKWQRTRFADLIKAATGVDIFPFIGSADATDEVTASLRRYTGLISNINADLQQRVGETVWREYLKQTPRRKIGKMLQEQMGIGRRRANNIAIDQTTKLSATLDEVRQKQAGGKQFEWMHSAKAHPRPEHVARNGKVYSWNRLPADGAPGTLPNCLPSWQPVDVGHDDVFRVWRHRFSGNLTEIVAEAAEPISCTPNHPILTRAGWKPAKAIDIGDDLVEVVFSGADILDVEVVERQARVGDLFATAQALHGAVTFNASGAEFHGDALLNEQIDVVSIEGGLRADLIAALNESIGESVFEQADVAAVFLSRLGASGLLGERYDATADGFVSIARLLLSRLRAQVVHDELGGGRWTADLYAFTAHQVGERLARYAEATAKRIDAVPANISPNSRRAIILESIVGRAVDLLDLVPPPGFEVLTDHAVGEADLGGDPVQQRAGFHLRYHKVENVVRRAWEGQVFDLQTGTGWFHAGNVVIKNCGCKARMYLPGVSETSDARERHVARFEAVAV